MDYIKIKIRNKKAIKYIINILEDIGIDSFYKYKEYKEEDIKEILIAPKIKKCSYSYIYHEEDDNKEDTLVIDCYLNNIQEITNILKKEIK